MRRPASVLVHGKLQSPFFSEGNQFASDLQIQDEGLLGKDMVASHQGRPDKSRAISGVNRQVEDGNVGSPDNVCDLVGSTRARKISIAPRFRTIEVAVEQ